MVSLLIVSAREREAPTTGIACTLRARCWRVKGASRIAKHHLLPLEQHEHIGVLVVPTIHELQRHRYQARIGPIKMRSQIDLRARRIPCGEVDDLNVPVKIECDEMAGMCCAIALADYHINLEGAWVAVVQIIPGRPDPADHELAQEHHHHCDDHPDPDGNHRDVLLVVCSQARRGFPRGDIHWRGRLCRWLRCLSARGPTNTWWLLPFAGSRDGAMTQRAPGVKRSSVEVKVGIRAPPLLVGQREIHNTHKK
jgi:hypothetical protein